ncbi:hypothetical protein [Kaistella jeonii]|uniref:Uncharacterized protein n=1 Tax=Kaistella jeonii TaxID=266749 RepID=A0A0C1ER02_9FLAO|nr:hypothetical protein [Kaistella jeonii]KIA82313.1 hypothetical protein OA86_15105 [Kaistella jeonii]SFC44902.1 hypothetical protein SAMN05421876_1277 [Kaistella jeonii]VEI96517.1 Uncharacterised protein [Kaistella jeonii]
MKKLLSFLFLLLFTFVFSQNKKYMFVVIKGEEVTSVSTTKTWSDVVKVSDVIEVKNFNRDKQAYIENEIVKNFLLYTTFGNKVKSKKAYIFNSYYEASKKRDAFLFAE